MSIIGREALTAATLLEMVGNLDDFDVSEVLNLLSERCVQLLDVSAAVVLLAGDDGRLVVTGASTDDIVTLGDFGTDDDESPWVVCYRTRSVVRRPIGSSAICAVPLRLKDTVLGCLCLFAVDAEQLPDGDLALAQTLADVATIALLQDRATRSGAMREGQLQRALISRIPIEQAKGMIAEHSHIDVEEAYVRMRAFARNNNWLIGTVAESLIAGTLSTASIRVQRPSVPQIARIAP